MVARAADRPSPAGPTRHGHEERDEADHEEAGRRGDPGDHGPRAHRVLVRIRIRGRRHRHALDPRLREGARRAARRGLQRHPRDAGGDHPRAVAELRAEARDLHRRRRPAGRRRARPGLHALLRAGRRARRHHRPGRRARLRRRLQPRARVGLLLRGPHLRRPVHRRRLRALLQQGAVRRGRARPGGPAHHARGDPRRREGHHGARRQHVRLLHPRRLRRLPHLRLHPAHLGQRRRRALRGRPHRHPRQPRGGRRARAHARHVDRRQHAVPRPHRRRPEHRDGVPAGHRRHDRRRHRHHGRARRRREGRLRRHPAAREGRRIRVLRRRRHPRHPRGLAERRRRVGVRGVGDGRGGADDPRRAVRRADPHRPARRRLRAPGPALPGLRRRAPRGPRAIQPGRERAVQRQQRGLGQPISQSVFGGDIPEAQREAQADAQRILDSVVYVEEDEK